MPAKTLSDDPATVDPFDVLGRRDPASQLMVHALLCNEPAPRGDVTTQTLIRCAHMGPPLGPRTTSCHAVGSAGLSDAHRRKIQVFVDDRLQERAAEMQRLRKLGTPDRMRIEYRIEPPATPPEPAFPLWRFSCVGFVLQAYRAARIELLGQPMPMKTVAELKQLYPLHADLLDDPDVRARVGIGEGDRWPVALVGYVLNSLSRDVAAIHAAAYVPQPGDEYFPPEPPIAE